MDNPKNKTQEKEMVDEIFNSSNKITKDSLKPIDIPIETFLEAFNSPMLCVLQDKDSKSPNRNYMFSKISKKNICLFFEKFNADITEESEGGRRDIYFTPNGRFGNQDIKTVNPDNQKSFPYYIRQWFRASHFDFLIFDFDIQNSLDEAISLISYLSFIMGEDVRPNFIIQTKRGIHLYFKLETPITLTEEELRNSIKFKNNIYYELYDILSGSKFFKGKIDSSVRDISRLMRLPNSLYWKRTTLENGKSGDYVDSSFRTGFLYYEESVRINFHKLLDKLRRENERLKEDNRVISEEKKAYSSCGYSSEYLEVQEKAEQIDMRDILKALGYDFKGLQIIENGVITNGYRIDPVTGAVKNFTLEKSYRTEGKGYPFLLNYFRGDRKQALEFLKTKFNIDTTSLEKAKRIVDVTVPVENDEIYIEGVGYLRANHSKKCMYFLPVKTDKNKNPTEQKVTDCIINVIGYTSTDAGKKAVVSFENKHTSSKAMFLPDSASATEFMKAIRKVGLFYVIGASQKLVCLFVEWTKMKMMETPEINLIYHIGYNKDGDFIAGQHVQKKDGKVVEINKSLGMIDNNLINFLSDNEEKLNKKLTVVTEKDGFDLIEGQYSDITEKEIKKLLTTDLPSLYESSKILPIFLSIAHSIFAFIYKTNGKQCHHTIVWGETQAGKSMLILFIKQLLRFRKLSGTGCSTITRFPLLTSTASGIPVHLTEYDHRTPEPKLVEIQGILKESFDGDSIVRGTQNLDIVNYRSIGSFIVDGESLPNISAVQTRSITTFCSRDDRKNVGDFYKFTTDKIEEYNGLINYMIEKMLPYSENPNSLFEKEKENERVILEKLKEVLGEKINDTDDFDRVLLCYSQIYTFATILMPTRCIEWDLILNALVKNIIKFLDTHKSYDSKAMSVQFLLRTISQTISRNRGDSLIDGFNIDTSTKIFKINLTLLEQFFNQKSQSEDFKHHITVLSEMGLIKSDICDMYIDLTNPKLKQYKSTFKIIISLLIRKEAITNISNHSFSIDELFDKKDKKEVIKNTF